MSVSMLPDIPFESTGWPLVVIKIKIDRMHIKLGLIHKYACTKARLLVSFVFAFKTAFSQGVEFPKIRFLITINNKNIHQTKHTK